MDVDEDQVGFFLPGGVDSAEAVRRDQNVDADVVEQDGQDFGNVGVILDDQDSLGRRDPAAYHGAPS